MTRAPKEKRAYGSGSVFVRHGSWYGKWRVGDRQVKRKLGPTRPVGSSDGLTRKQAEAALRRLIGEVKILAPEERITFSQAGERYIHHVEHVMQRKASTVKDYRIILERHLAPHFHTTPIDKIKPADLEAYIVAKSRAGLAIKTITNHLNFAHGVFRFALKRGWATSNPVAACDRPRAARGRPRHPLPHQRGARGALAGRPSRGRARADRSRALHARGDDRPAPGRARRAALARHRLDRGSGARAAHLQPRGVGDTQVATLEPRRAAGRPGRRRARAPLPALGIPRRRRPRLLPPPHRQPLRRLQAPRTLLRRDEGRRDGSTAAA